jgi:hypothetical protein
MMWCLVLIELLLFNQDESMQAFHLQSKKIIRSRQRTFFTRILLHKTFTAWRMDLYLATHSKRSKKKEAFEAWVIAAKRTKLSRLFTNISHVGYCKSQGRRALRKLSKHVRIMKKIKGCYTSDGEKDICAGMGHLRIWMKKLSVRRAFSKWMILHQQSISLNVAQKWHMSRVQRLVFRHFNAAAMNGIKARRVIKHIDDRLSSSEISSSNVPDTLRAKKERIRQFDEARLRRIQLQKAIDANILLQQREQRRQKVAALRAQREEQFQSAWAAKKVEAESACVERMKNWVLTSEFKEQSQKRFFSIHHASTSDKEREKAIASLSVIYTSILDAKLAQVGSCFDELFLIIEKMTSLINAVPFQSALVACGLIMTGSEFQELFHGITEYHQATSKDASIDIHKLQGLRFLADKYVAREGTRWKLYVSSIHQQQQLHNVFTNEKIIEKDIGKKHVRQMVSENMQDIEMLKVRKIHYEARRDAHKKMLEQHAATSIQALYHRFRGKQSRKKQQWILERKKLFRLRAKQAAAAMLIQRRYRLSKK